MSASNQQVTSQDEKCSSERLLTDGPRNWRLQNGRVATGLRMEPSLYARLKAAARARGVDVVWLVERLVAEGLDDLEPAPTVTVRATTLARRREQAAEVEREVYGR